MNLFDLSGKTALVTGGGQGLGHGYSINLAKAGANVVLFGRNTQKLEITASEIQKNQGNVFVFEGDVTKPECVHDAVDAAYKQFGHLDILVNNAGTEIAEDFMQVTAEHFDRIISVNLKGTFLMSQAAAAYMMKQKSGKIINIASLGSYIGLPGSSVYCSSKGAVSQLTKTMAIELATCNIQVNAIAPGYFRTEMTESFFEDEKHAAFIQERIPLGRVGTEDDLAGTIVFLASQASNYITGQTIIVDGGWLAG